MVLLFATSKKYKKRPLYTPLTCWITECTSCRTEVFKFMRQRILTQHLANYCCVASIQGLLVFASYRTSKLDLDQNQSVTDLDQSKQEIGIINTKRIMFPQRLFQLGFYIDSDLTYVFFFFFF